jgi:plasmid stabilization system protein ParE
MPVCAAGIPPKLIAAITPRALAQNRRAAADAVRSDLTKALEVLAQQPGIGARCASSHYSDVLRLCLARARYRAYCRVSGDTLAVLAFWHARRARGPKL